MHWRCRRWGWGGVSSFIFVPTFSKKKDPGRDAGVREGNRRKESVDAVCLPGGEGDVMGVTKRRIAGSLPRLLSLSGSESSGLNPRYDCSASSRPTDGRTMHEIGEAVCQAPAHSVIRRSACIQSKNPPPNGTATASPGGKKIFSGQKRGSRKSRSVEGRIGGALLDSLACV
jgi:hypothetical protein